MKKKQVQLLIVVLQCWDQDLFKLKIKEEAGAPPAPICNIFRAIYQLLKLPFTIQIMNYLKTRLFALFFEELIWSWSSSVWSFIDYSVFLVTVLSLKTWLLYFWNTWGKSKFFKWSSITFSGSWHSQQLCLSHQTLRGDNIRR